MYLRYLRGHYQQWHDVLNHFPITVTETLIRTLATRVELVPGDADPSIEEMAELCDELLNSESDVSTDSMPVMRAIMDFATVVDPCSKRAVEWKIPSDKVIGCLRNACTRLSNFHYVSFVLARCLLMRLFMTASNDDYKEGMAILDKIRAPFSTKGRASSDHELALKLAAAFDEAQFFARGGPEHLEQAIYHNRTWLDVASLEHPERPWFVGQVSRLQERRFNDSPAMGSFSSSESVKLPSTKDLIASLAKFNPVEPVSITTYNGFFHALDPFYTEHLTDIVDIEERVKFCQKLLASYPNSTLSPFAHFGLIPLLYRAFRCTGDIECLNQAISTARDNFNTATLRIFRVGSLFYLIKYLATRLDLFRRAEDLDELMQLFPIASNHEVGNITVSFYTSCEWASIARRFGNPSAWAAYDRAMLLMQNSLIFAPTLDVQHSRLVEMSTGVTALPLDYTSYQIFSGRLEQAIETLEQGRALLWSEMRGLRTSIDKLRAADSHLADKFAAVNRDLEVLTLTSSLDGNVDIRHGDIEGMEPFGHLVARQRKLLGDRENLISQIQALSGFDTFLKPPSFGALHSVACHGPVVIINHSKWRSYILILLRNCPPSLITTPDDFHSRANKLQDQLLQERKKGLDSDKYDDALRSVLKELYELVGRPVIKRLNELNVPEQSRVWWCPTSVFCSLPLHAMGPISHDVGPARYFLDLYITSYIPSLSALIESRKPSSQAVRKPSILLVTQLDETLQEAWKEMKAVQAVDTQVTPLVSAKATPTTVLRNLRDHRFAHIACHGILEPGKPFEASFKLHRGKRLPLLDIVRSQLPDAEFAFLSACHTAELTDESLADEVLHLAAAMQFCGFRSVVGTMWAMADTDGPDLARNFYRSVFSDSTQCTRYYERTAGALRDAVVKLRRKNGMTFERWVNYVHYGA
jgi:CHAT domain-containing protein